MSGGLTIRAMTSRDWPQVKAIYEAGIATGNATFETEAPDWEAWDRGHLADHRLVAANPDEPDEPDEVLGWAALSPVSNRSVYVGVAENSIYIAPHHRGRGVGRALLQALVDASDAAGLWTIQTGIFPENVASVRLHEACGFRVVGRRERIGQLHGVWRDTLFLERRSSVAGLPAPGG